jgi:hypothetical protein
MLFLVKSAHGIQSRIEISFMELSRAITVS